MQREKPLQPKQDLSTYHTSDALAERNSLCHGGRLTCSSIQISWFRSKNLFHSLTIRLIALLCSCSRMAGDRTGNMICQTPQTCLGVAECPRVTHALSPHIAIIPQTRLGASPAQSTKSLAFASTFITPHVRDGLEQGGKQLID